MVQISELTNLLATKLTLADAINLYQPLLIFILGIAVYSIFIFKFYRFVGKREIFKIDMKKYSGFGKFFHGFMYVVKHIIIFPFITFFWFIILSLILAFLSKEGDMQTVLLIAISLVAVIRIMAYYSEDLSKDLAKMLPFALLGVFLVDISYFSFTESLTTIAQLPTLWVVMLYYLLFLIVLEILIRIIFSIIGMFGKEKE